MNVKDLYLIARELKQIVTLQANLAATISKIDKESDALMQQRQAHEQLRKLVGEYEQYSI